MELLEKIQGRIKISATGCWEWQGAKTKAGYGTMTPSGSGKQQYTHRLMWELMIEPIPKGLQIDHLCQNHACCNPSHLEPVTHKENQRRSWAKGRKRKPKTHCKRGHAWTEENTYLFPSRQCRVCRVCLLNARRKRDLLRRKSGT